MTSSELLSTWHAPLSGTLIICGKSRGNEKNPITKRYTQPEGLDGVSGELGAHGCYGNELTLQAP